MTQTPSALRRPIAVTAALGLILGLGFLLRLRGLDTFPYEQDEVYTQIESKFLFDSPLHPGIEARPLYYLLQHALTGVFPTHPVGWRLLPLIFGMLGIWVTWRLGRRMSGISAGLIAAFFVAISPWHIYASGMARYWSLVYLLAAAFYLLLQDAYETDDPRAYLGAFAVLAMGSLTHPTFVFPAAGAVLGLSLVTPQGGLGWRWPSRRGWIWLWLPYLALGIVLVLVLRWSGHGASVRNFNGRGTLAALRLVPAIVEWVTPVMFVAGIAWAVPTAVVGPREIRQAGAIAACGWGMALLLLFVSGGVTNTYADYGIAMLPLILAGVGALVAGLVAASEHQTRSALLLTGVLAAGVLPSTLSHLVDGTRFDYRPAYAEIARSDPALPVLTWPMILLREYAPELHGLELRANRAYLDSILKREKAVWIVVSVQRYGIVKDPSGALAGWLADRCHLIDSYERHRLDYRTYRVDRYRCQT